MTAIALLLLNSSLAATPTYTVVVTRRVGIDTAAGVDLADMFSRALLRKGQKLEARSMSPRVFLTRIAAPNTPDAAQCAGTEDCTAELGRIGGVDWIFALQVARVAADTILDVSLISVAEAKSVASGNATIPHKKPIPAMEAIAAEMVAKAPSLAVVAVPPPPPPKPEAVTVPVVTPPAPGGTVSGSEGTPSGAAEVTAASETYAGQSASGLLVGALGLSDVLHPSVGGEIFAGYRWGGFEASARGRLGALFGVGLSIGYGFELGRAEPFVALRGDFYPRAKALSVGGQLGVRVGVGAGVGAIAQLGFEKLLGTTGYQSTALVGALGVDWRQ